MSGRSPPVLNLQPAINARVILQVENHSLAYCLRYVYRPTKQMLDEYAAANPLQLTCASSLSYTRSLGLPPEQADIDLLRADGTLLYLGRVYCRAAAERAWELSQKLVDQALAELLRERGPLAVVRSSHGLLIPVDTDELTPERCAAGALTYLEQVCPALASLSIRMLPSGPARRLYEQIEDELRRRK